MLLLDLGTAHSVKVINLFKIFLKYALVSYFPHFTNWNVQFWVLLLLSTMISKINTWTRECVSYFPLAIAHFISSERNEQFASVSPDFHRELRCGLLQQQLILSCGWLEFQGQNASCSWFYPAANSSSDDWIRVTAESILRLTRAPAPGSELRLIPSCGWIEFRQMDTSYSWLHPTDDTTSSGWIRLKAVSIQQLTKTCGWLEFQKLHSSYSWFHPATDSMLPLTRVHRLDLTCNWFIL